MRWMWIDRVVELDPGRRLTAVKNVSLAEEHLHDHFASEGALPALPVMPASLIIEGVAQAGGILVGHAEGFRHKVILAKISRAEIERDAGPGMTLRYGVEMERFDAQGASIRAVVELLDHSEGAGAAYARIGTVELMYSHLDNNMGSAGEPGREFPEHNFVFSEALQTLLRTSGIEVEAHWATVSGR